MSYLTEALADSPLGLWMLDETSGTTAADSSGNSRHLTINGSVTKGAATVMPTGTSAFSFPQLTSAHLIRASEAWMQVPSYTMTAWVNPSNIASYNSILTRDGATRGPAFYGTDGRLNLFVTSDTATSIVLANGTSYFVAAAYDNAAQTLRFYLNGSLILTVNSITKPNSAANDLIVGATRGGTGSSLFYPWYGRIGPVGYFPSALSTERILAHYNAGITANITVAGEAWEAPATWLDGVIDTSLIVQGEAWSAPATWLDGTATSIPGTDISNVAGARRRGGIGTVTMTVPVAPVPPGTSRSPRADKAVALPTPTMVDGRPT